MSKITEGTRVVVIEDGELKKGVVTNVYHFSDIAIVAFDDESYSKVPLSQLAIEPVAEPDKNQEPTEPSEPVEKSEITITPEAFREISMRTVFEMTKDKPIVGLALTMFSAELHRALFYDAVEND